MSRGTHASPVDPSGPLDGQEPSAGPGVSRRTFLQGAGTVVASLSPGSWTTGCTTTTGGGQATSLQQYPIDPTAATTAQRMITFPISLSPVTTNLLPAPPPSPNGSQGLAATQLNQVEQYDALGYGTWSFGSPLPVLQRADLMPAGYSNPTPARITRFLRFFSFSDIHITDKEAPDPNRWAWPQSELAAGQAANQLMIIAAHVPIGVMTIGSEMEWWLGEPATTAPNQNAVTLAGLVQTLWNASSNVELLKQLSPAMIAALQGAFPAPAPLARRP